MSKYIYTGWTMWFIHPIRAWGACRDTYNPCGLNLIHNYCKWWHRLHNYNPITKASRFVGYMICHRIKGHRKYIDYNCIRLENDKICCYDTLCGFYWVTLGKEKYNHDGDITILRYLLLKVFKPSKAKALREKFDVIFSGWVFTEKKAYQILDKIQKTKQHMIADYGFIRYPDNMDKLNDVKNMSHSGKQLANSSYSIYTLYDEIKNADSKWAKTKYLILDMYITYSKDIDSLKRYFTPMLITLNSMIVIEDRIERHKKIVKTAPNKEGKDYILNLIEENKRDFTKLKKQFYDELNDAIKFTLHEPFEYKIYM